jgi:hypothetical protein
MLLIWVSILNFLSALEYKIADFSGEAGAIIFHFFLFWLFPIILLFIPVPFLSIVGILISVFYVYVLSGDIFLSVFGHEKLEKKRGMIDIISVHEIREEIIGALVKYLGGIISFATIFNGLQKLFEGKAFMISNPSPLPYLDLLYYSLITVTTVGYGDILPTNWIAKVFAMGEILFGLGFVLLLFTMLISLYIDIMRKKKY